MGCQPMVLLPLLICATPGRSTLDVEINSGPTFDRNLMGMKHPTHRIHVCILTYIYHKFRPNVGKYTRLLVMKHLFWGMRKPYEMQAGELSKIDPKNRWFPIPDAQCMIYFPSFGYFWGYKYMDPLGIGILLLLEGVSFFRVPAVRFRSVITSNCPHRTHLGCHSSH